MITLNRLLDAAQKNCDPPTAIELAARLAVSRQTLYTWKSGDLPISDDHLARVAKLAQANPEEVVSVLRERATSETEKAMWTTLARRLGAAAALAVALIPATESHAGNASNPLIRQGVSQGLYIMFRRIRTVFGSRGTVTQRTARWSALTNGWAPA